MPRLIALLTLATALCAQTIDGTLTNSITHAPIANVIVTLIGSGRYNGTTDDTGAFHIDQVRPGKYVLNIVKAGYILPTERRAAFQVDSDMRLSVQMDPLGTVEGRVRLSDGRPALRASVWLSLHPNGQARSVNADTGGHFLFDDVKPGQYLLRAAAAPGDPAPEGEIWAATYLPSVADRDGAELIRVVTGANATYEIRLRSVPSRHIRGMVRDEVGRPASGVTITLNSAALAGPQTTQTNLDGNFDFVALDGECRLSATRKDGDVERQGFANATVARQDVENVEIRLALPFSVPIILEREAPPPAGGRPIRPTVSLYRVDGPSFMRPAADAITNVYPGRYRIYILGNVPGEYVESIKLGDADIHGRPFEIWDGSLPIRITYKRGAPPVCGTVESGDGATVFMMHVEESLAGEGYRAVDAGRGGSFEFGNVRPGDYYVFALETKGAAIGTPTFQRAVLPRAAKIHLEKDGAVVLNLKIIPWPE